MNNVVLIGRLTRDPELRTVNGQNGPLSTCNFTIAVTKLTTNQNGERDADFINCVAWGKQAENLCKYCSKGSQIAVQGRIQTRNYQNKDGVTVYVTEVSATTVTFLGSKNSNGNTGMDFPQLNNNISHAATTDITEDPFKDFGSEVVLSDDDLPF